MHVTDDPRMAVSSKLADLREVPLAEMPGWGMMTNDLPGRVLPGVRAAPVPVAVFQSAI